MVKQSRPKPIVTPAGAAVYPHINRPDTKFKAEGEFHTKLRIPADKAKDLVRLIDARMEEAKKLPELVKARKNNPKKPIPENTPYSMVVDEETGEETGDVEFTFKSKASGVSKKTGKEWSRKVKLFDAKKKPVTEDVWGGSTIKVAFVPSVYFINAKVGYGVKLNLEAVQVIDLVTGSGGTADQYGFGEEEGYESAEIEENETTSGDGGDGEDNGDEAEDF